MTRAEIMEAIELADLAGYYRGPWPFEDVIEKREVIEALKAAQDAIAGGRGGFEEDERRPLAIVIDALLRKVVDKRSRDERCMSCYSTSVVVKDYFRWGLDRVVAQADAAERVASKGHFSTDVLRRVVQCLERDLLGIAPHVLGSMVRWREEYLERARATFSVFPFKGMTEAESLVAYINGAIEYSRENHIADHEVVQARAAYERGVGVLGRLKERLGLPDDDDGG